MSHALSATDSVAPQPPGRTPHKAPQAPYAASRRRGHAFRSQRSACEGGNEMTGEGAGHDG